MGVCSSRASVARRRNVSRLGIGMDRGCAVREVVMRFRRQGTGLGVSAKIANERARITCSGRPGSKRGGDHVFFLFFSPLSLLGGVCLSTEFLNVQF